MVTTRKTQLFLKFSNGNWKMDILKMSIFEKQGTFGRVFCVRTDFLYFYNYIIFNTIIWYYYIFIIYTTISETKYAHVEAFNTIQMNKNK
jgi:hypothetical protein